MFIRSGIRPQSPRQNLFVQIKFWYLLSNGSTKFTNKLLNDIGKKFADSRKICPISSFSIASSICNGFLNNSSKQKSVVTGYVLYHYVYIHVLWDLEKNLDTDYDNSVYNVVIYTCS